MDGFDGKVALITGATGNIGQAVTRAFEARGAHLAILDRSPHRLEQIFGDLVNHGDHLMIGSLDLTDEVGAERAAAQTIHKFGRIDILVNTVGGYRAGTTVEETPTEVWDFMLNLNARTVFLICRSVIPFMKTQKSGRIINIGALGAQTGKPKMAAYSVSKTAVVRLTESMASELQPFNIMVNAILPMNIDTPENRAENPGADFSKWTKPESIAEVILFLASPASRAVTGAAIPVQGGG